jgi:hypothetical protein
MFLFWLQIVSLLAIVWHPIYADRFPFDFILYLNPFYEHTK